MIDVTNRRPKAIPKDTTKEKLMRYSPNKISAFAKVEGGGGKPKTDPAADSTNDSAADLLQNYYTEEEGRINASYDNKKTQLETTRDTAIADAEASRRQAEQQNYINYRRLISRYLPEQMASSGLYDAASIAQPMLDAENSYISRNGDIRATHDAAVRAAKTDYADGVYKAEQDKTTALSALQKYQFENQREDERQQREDEKQQDAENAAQAEKIRGQLLNYIDIFADSDSHGANDIEALENFETEYADALAELEELDPSAYREVLDALGFYLGSDAYSEKVDAYEESERLKGLQGEVEVQGHLPVKKIDEADQGQTVNVTVRNTNKNQDETWTGASRVTNGDVLDAAAGLGNNTMFWFRDRFYVKDNNGLVYAFKQEESNDSSYPSNQNDNKPLLQTALEAAQDAAYQVFTGNFWQDEDPLTKMRR